MKTYGDLLKKKDARFSLHFVKKTDTNIEKYFQNTTSGINKICSLWCEIHLYGKPHDQMNQDPITFYWRYLRQNKTGTSGKEEINSLKFVIVTQWVQIPLDQSLVSRSIEKSEGKPGNRSPKPDMIENVGLVLSFENNINCGHWINSAALQED